jgi:hypothetical protein
MIMGRFRLDCTWTNWYLGFWFWPVVNHRAFGVCLGPLSLTWAARGHH